MYPKGRSNPYPVRQAEPQVKDNVIIAVICFLAILISSKAFYEIGYAQAIQDASKLEWWCLSSEERNAVP